MEHLKNLPIELLVVVIAICGGLWRSKGLVRTGYYRGWIDPNPFGPSTWVAENTRDYSLFVDYTAGAGGGGGTVSSRRGVIMMM